ncbi:MAG: HepT-like ribonuclease domain-containing protein [Candidatus Edwardsbacteria bacterium]
MKKDNSTYLRHILDAISRIEEYTQEIKYEDFLDNHLIQDGVIRQIERPYWRKLKENAKEN